MVGAPDRIRTCDLWLRKPTLYPTELRARHHFFISRDLGPKGVHVAYITIDAVIDTPWTREPFHPDKPDEFFSKPDAIADEVFHVAHQDRSTWSFDVIIRPYAEKW